jgi:predicted nucleic acid-binding protein
LAKALVFDATPLIYLVRVSLGESLRRLSNSKYVPESVYQELMRGEALGKPEPSIIRELVEDATITVTRPRNTSFVRRLAKIAAEDTGKPLHMAEAEALALARELDGIMIADDQVARSIAKMVHAEVHGTGYLLGKMYLEHQLSKEGAITKVGEMRRAGWRLSEDDYREILNYLSGL